MPTTKRILCPERLRRIPKAFSWVDHRLVRDRHISRCSHEALALYLFLVTVADAEGLSYYSDAKAGGLLNMDAAMLASARRDLCGAGLIGQAPVFNPRYRDFAGHFGFTIKACGVGKGNEKGRVENAVGYIKKNFLGGLDIPEFSAVNPAAREWLDTVANVRVHGATRKKPVELFGAEKPAMRPLSAMPYDVSTVRSTRATNRFRVVLDTNRYSVPAEYAGQRLRLKTYPDRICIYQNAKLIAQHPRSYDRNQDFEDPDHPKALLAQRHAAREQRLLMHFLKLSPRAEAYYQQLQQRRMNPRHHIRQIVALSEIYAAEKIARAIEDAFSFQAFSCEYIANILEQRERLLPEPGALHLTRRQDLLELELPEPDLLIYEPENDEPQGESDDEHEEDPQSER